MSNFAENFPPDAKAMHLTALGVAQTLRDLKGVAACVTPETVASVIGPLRWAEIHAQGVITWLMRYNAEDGTVELAYVPAYAELTREEDLCSANVIMLASCPIAELEVGRPD